MLNSEKEDYHTVIIKKKTTIMREIIRTITAIVLAYLFSWVVDLAFILFFGLFPLDGGLSTTLVFGICLFPVVFLSVFIISFLSLPLANLIKGNKWIAVLPTLIFILHGVYDIFTLFYTVKGVDVGSFYYCRAILMAVFIVGSYWYFSHLLTQEDKT